FTKELEELQLSYRKTEEREEKKSRERRESCEIFRDLPQHSQLDSILDIDLSLMEADKYEDRYVIYLRKNKIKKNKEEKEFDVLEKNKIFEKLEKNEEENIIFDDKFFFFDNDVDNLSKKNVVDVENKLNFIEKFNIDDHLLDSNGLENLLPAVECNLLPPSSSTTPTPRGGVNFLNNTQLSPPKFAVEEKKKADMDFDFNNFSNLKKCYSNLPTPTKFDTATVSNNNFSNNPTGTPKLNLFTSFSTTTTPTNLFPPNDVHSPLNCNTVKSNSILFGNGIKNKSKLAKIKLKKHTNLNSTGINDTLENNVNVTIEVPKDFYTKSNPIISKTTTTEKKNNNNNTVEDLKNKKINFFRDEKILALNKRKKNLTKTNSPLIEEIEEKLSIKTLDTAIIPTNLFEKNKIKKNFSISSISSSSSSSLLVENNNLLLLEPPPLTNKSKIQRGLNKEVKNKSFLPIPTRI
ncbi:hypothetical protein HK099_002947, partial [Clydaea vesicula]